MKKKFKELKKERNGLHTVNASIKELEKKKVKSWERNWKIVEASKIVFFLSFFDRVEKSCVCIFRGDFVLGTKVESE